ncbi:MAG: hypothetical protein V1796_00225 [Pseudomonadota bacterium]
MRLKYSRMPPEELRAARANRVFGTDEKHIRTENTVMDKSNHGLGLLLSKIADCVRMRFSSVRNRRSARTASRPRNLATLPQRRA